MFIFVYHYRKTMENIRNRLNFNLVHTKKGLQRLVSKPSFESFTIFNSDLVGVKKQKGQAFTEQTNLHWDEHIGSFQAFHV